MPRSNHANWALWECTMAFRIAEERCFPLQETFRTSSSLRCTWGSGHIWQPATAGWNLYCVFINSNFLWAVVTMMFLVAVTLVIMKRMTHVTGDDFYLIVMSYKSKLIWTAPFSFIRFEWIVAIYRKKSAATREWVDDTWRINSYPPLLILFPNLQYL